MATYEVRTLGDLGGLGAVSNGELAAASQAGMDAALARARAGKPLAPPPAPGGFSFSSEEDRQALAAAWSGGYARLAAAAARNPAAVKSPGGKGGGGATSVRCSALVPLVDVGAGAAATFVPASTGSAADASAWGYRLHEGVTLWALGVKFLGDGNAWRRIWAWNLAHANDLGTNPNKINIYGADGLAKVILLPPEANVRAACAFPAGGSSGVTPIVKPAPKVSPGIWLTLAAAAVAAVASAKS